LAALSAISAFAQSSVAIYGVMDHGFESIKYTNNNNVANANGKFAGAAGSNSASSRLGFKGTEDLGGGMKANFNYEFGFDGTQIDSTAGKHRVSTVGLQSASLGKFDIGFNKIASQVLLEGLTVSVNNFVGSGFLYKKETVFATGVKANAWIRPVDQYLGARATGLHYTSPKIADFTVTATLGNTQTKDEDGSVTNRTKATLSDVALVYTGVKGLTLGLSNASSKTGTADALTDVKNQLTQFGAGYTMGAVTVIAHHVESKETATTGAEATKLSGNQYGVKFKATPALTLFAQMANTDEKEATVKTYKRKSSQYGADYAFSKRTSVYAMIGQSKADKVGDADLSKNSGYALGVRHSF
jgi:predicted porin